MASDVSIRGNCFFSGRTDTLRVAEKFSSDFYLELNLSANQIKTNIKELLEHVGIDYKEMKIYVR